MLRNVKSNKQFMILSVIGIVAMVSCHIAGEIFKIFKLFPFITIFIFISGYFYKETSEKDIIKFIWYKFKKLIIPFFIINCAYGIIVSILNKLQIIHYGTSITLYALFIQPLLNNSQFVFNFPMWYVPTIFITYTAYIVIHHLSSRIKLNDELLLLVFILFHVISIYYSDLVSNNSFLIILFRLMFFLPFFQIGHLYKKKWQKKEEKAPNFPYILMLIGVNYILYKIFGDLNYDLHEFSGFNQSLILLPFIASIIGILFYTRIAKIITPLIRKKQINKLYWK